VQIAAQAASGNGLTLYFIALLLGLSWGGGLSGVESTVNEAFWPSRRGRAQITLPGASWQANH